MIFTPQELKDAEKNCSIPIDTLMAHAGHGIARAIKQFFPTPGTALCYIGKGHNGGDVLAAIETLHKLGWQIQIRTDISISQDFRPFTHKQYSAVKGLFTEHKTTPDFSKHDIPNIIIDGLLGMGCKGKLREPYEELCAEINYISHQTNSSIISIDIPTGLNAETGEADENTVCADFTLAIAHAKTGQIKRCAEKHIGRLAIIPLPELSDAVGDPSIEINTAKTLSGKTPHRKSDSHKGSVGRIAILGGSRGMTGATALSARSALQFGAGLVTIFTDESLYPIQVSQVPPEIIVRPITDINELATDKKNDILIIGPGLNPEHPQKKEIWDIIHTDPKPIVIDAGAIELLGNQVNDTKNIFAKNAGKRILTPHMGELIRLLEKIKYPGKLDEKNINRRDISEWLLERADATFVLKSAATYISEHGHPISVNTTGHAGMATGGSGDILVGGIGSLIGQGTDTYNAACLASWICGRSAELAVPANINFTLTPTDILDNIKPAWLSLSRQDL